MEARAVSLIGRKQRAAKLLYGDNDVGLSELTGGGDDANDLIAELAKSLDADDEVTDLRDLFKAASHAETTRESLWAAESSDEDHVPLVIADPEPQLETVQAEAPSDEESQILVANWPQRELVTVDRVIEQPTISQLKPKPKAKRRKLSLSDAPIELESGSTPEPSQPLPPPTNSEPQQLSFFDW